MNIIFFRFLFNVLYVMYFCVNILVLLYVGVGEVIIVIIFVLLNSLCIILKICMKKVEYRVGCVIESFVKELCDVILIDEIEKLRYMIL